MNNFSIFQHNYMLHNISRHSKFTMSHLVTLFHILETETHKNMFFPHKLYINASLEFINHRHRFLEYIAIAFAFFLFTQYMRKISLKIKIYRNVPALEI